MNLFGSSSIDGYEDYVHHWLAIATPQVLSYDNYPVWDDSLASQFRDRIGADWTADYFYNLELFRQLSYEKDLPFWNWILVHKHWSSYSHRYYRRASISDIRLQIYSSLAYGAKGILYYNFWNPPQMFNQNGWHEESALLDSVGQKTRLFDDVKRLNTDILSIGDTLLQLRSCGVYHVSNEYPSNLKSPEKLFSRNSSNTESPYGIKLLGHGEFGFSPRERETEIVKKIDNPAGFVGILRNKNNGEYYLFLVNKNRKNGERFVVQLDRTKFPAASSLAVQDAATLAALQNFRPEETSWEFSIYLDSGAGKLLRLINSKQ